MKNKQYWYSSPFFAYKGGYQIRLRVSAAECKGTHVSVHLYLMKGPHDDKLEQPGHWPLRATFTIELLNQFNDSFCHLVVYYFDNSTCANRIMYEGYVGMVYGGDFISLNDLLYNIIIATVKHFTSEFLTVHVIHVPIYTINY